MEWTRKLLKNAVIFLIILTAVTSCLANAAKENNTCIANPDSFEDWMIMGDWIFNTSTVDGNNYEYAVSVYRVALNLNPSDAVAWYKLGNSYFALKEYDKAEYAYNYALIMDSGFTEANDAKQEALAKQGKEHGGEVN